MLDTDLYHIGKIIKAHGVKGELRLDVFDAFWDDFEALEVLFVKQKGKNMPCFIKDMRGSFPSVFILIEDVENPEQAKKYAGLDFYALKKNLDPASIEEHEQEDDRSYLQLVGYSIQDKEQGHLGPISEIVALPHQNYAIIKHNKQEVMIPLINALITHIDHPKKIIETDLPLGLLDLNDGPSINDENE